MAKFGCDTCGTQWSGLSACHCATCHLQFRSVSGFDLHRTGEGRERRCLTVEELSVRNPKNNKPRMVATQTTFGPVWVSEARPA